MKDGCHAIYTIHKYVSHKRWWSIRPVHQRMVHQIRQLCPMAKIQWRLRRRPRQHRIRMPNVMDAAVVHQRRRINQEVRYLSLCEWQFKFIIKGKGNGKLWEFIRDLLLNPLTNPSLIRWERREDGIFKFIQSDKVAKMWGERKQNPRMTYEKLSRAMRYVLYFLLPECFFIRKLPKSFMQFHFNRFIVL